MTNARIGHSALTWDVLSQPEKLVNAVVDCAEIGFAGTETGGFVFDWWEREHPGALKPLLADHGVAMACLFEFGDWIDPDAATTLIESGKRWAAGVQELGGSMLMLVPGGRRDEPPYGLDEFKQMADLMNRVGQEAVTAGAQASIHPHWGTMAESRLEIDVLLNFLDPAVVGFAPDTGQIAKGGTDPMMTIDRWSDRIQHVHLKDLSPKWAEMRQAGVPLRSPEGYVELGEGVIDFQPLMTLLAGTNYTGWIIAELDEANRPAREAAQISWDYLTKRHPELF